MRPSRGVNNGLVKIAGAAYPRDNQPPRKQLLT
jgi:hypothetical protein